MSHTCSSANASMASTSGGSSGTNPTKTNCSLICKQKNGWKETKAGINATRERTCFKRTVPGEF